MSLFNTIFNTVSTGVSFLLNPELETTRHYLGIMEEATIIPSLSMVNSSTIDLGIKAVSESVISNFSNMTNMIAAMPDVSKNLFNIVVDNGYEIISNSTSAFINQDAPTMLSKGLAEADISPYMLPLTAAIPVVAYIGFAAYDYYTKDSSVQETAEEDMPTVSEPEVLPELQQIVSLSARNLGKKVLDTKDRNFTVSFNSMSIAQKSTTLSVDNSTTHGVQSQEMMLAADEVAKGLSKLLELGR